MGEVRNFLLSRLGIASVVGFTTTFALVGLWLGKAFSPDYGGTKSGVAYFISHFEYQIDSDGDVELSLPIDTILYRYRLSSNVLEKEALPYNILQRLQTENKWRSMEFSEAASLAGASLSGGILGGSFALKNGIIAVSGPARTNILGVIAVFSLVGAAAGMLVGYDNEPDFDDPEFRSGLEDLVYWKSAAVQIRRCSVPEGTNNECREFIRSLANRNRDIPAPQGAGSGPTEEELGRLIDEASTRDPNGVDREAVP